MDEDRPLIETNPYLRDPAMRQLMLDQVAQESRAAKSSGLEGGYIVDKRED